jgi:NAD(P)-dependent dehydrogenase (short-subunit alcohol dehydrogenase family)
MSQLMLDKRVLVTGSGTGIGKGIALEFAREGAFVALHYSHSEGGALATVDQITKEGGRAKAFKADFTHLEEARKLVDEAASAMGGLDILVNNAGITTNIPFEKVTIEQFNTVFSVNIGSMYFACQAAVKPMLQQGSGVIINLTSVHAFQGLYEHSIYAATKGAIVAFTRELAVELGPKNIRVNAIAPGGVKVEHWDTVGDMDIEQQARNLPVGFIAEPRDIGRLCIFLASNEARYICGQTIIADGGQTSVMAGSDAFRKPSDLQFGRGYVPGLK